MLLLLIKDMEAHTLVLCKTHMQRINGTQCDDLNYTILSNYTSYTVQLTLTVQQPFAKSNIRTTGRLHSSNMFGHKFKVFTRICIEQPWLLRLCTSLVDNGVECDITRQTILCHPPVWIGHNLPSNIIQGNSPTTCCRG